MLSIRDVFVSVTLVGVGRVSELLTHELYFYLTR